MNKKGFTLIEIIIVLFIMGVVIATAMIAYTKAYNSEGIKVLLKNEKVIAEQIQKYYQIEGEIPQNATEFKNFLHNSDYFPTIAENPIYFGSDPADGWKWQYKNATEGVISSFDGKYPYTVTVQPFESLNKAIRESFSLPSSYGGAG